VDGDENGAALGAGLALGALLALAACCSLAKDGNWGDASNAANDYDYTGYGAPSATSPTMGPSLPTFVGGGSGVGSGRVYPSSPTYVGGGGGGLCPSPSYREGVLSPPRLTPSAPPVQEGVDDEQTHAAIEASRRQQHWGAGAFEPNVPVAKPVPN